MSLELISRHDTDCQSLKRLLSDVPLVGGYADVPRHSTCKSDFDEGIKQIRDGKTLLIDRRMVERIVTALEEK